MAVAETETEAVAETETETEAVAETETETEAVAETETETEAVAETETETETETEAVACPRGFDATQLKRPVILLRRAGRVRSVGQRRATRYFPIAAKVGGP